VIALIISCSFGATLLLQVIAVNSFFSSSSFQLLQSNMSPKVFSVKQP